MAARAAEICVMEYEGEYVQTKIKTIIKGDITMDRKELEQKIIELVAMSYGRDAADLTVDTTFGDDLSGASVQMVGLVSEIENELDVMVQLQVASACKTIGDLVDKVEEEL